jgi:hypothetical protein
LLVLAAVLTMGCVGPFADVVDEAMQDTPVDYDECCVGADRAMLEKLAGVPATAGTGTLAGLRVDAVVTTRQFDAEVEQDVDWGKDGDGLIAPDDTHDYVLALVSRPPGGDRKARVSTVVTVLSKTAAPVVHDSAALVDPSDGSPVPSMIIAVRVPAGHTVLLTADRPKRGDPAVDLRTGRAAKFPDA